MGSVRLERARDRTDRGAALTFSLPFSRARPAVSIRAAPAASYGVASARADRNRWPRGPSDALALSFFLANRPMASATESTESTESIDEGDPR
jgi:hypothetical protein